MEPIEFRASLPPIQSAIRLDGQGGARATLDIPEEDIVEVYKLNAMKGMVLLVTIAPLDEK